MLQLKKIYRVNPKTQSAEIMKFWIYLVVQKSDLE